MIENKTNLSTFAEESTKMDNQDNLISVIKALYNWRKPILLVCCIAAIGSAVLSVMFLDDYYQSTTTFYPASADLTKPSHIFGAANKDLNYYGTETDLDRIMTMAKSSTLSNFLIDSFNLYEHYEIVPGKPKSQEKIALKLSGLFDIKKTKYEAIELSVEDTDKDLARDMVNAAREKINELSQQVIKQNQGRVLSLMKQNTEIKQQELRTFGDSLITLRYKYGIYDIETQSELITSLAAQTESALSEKKAALESLKKAPRVPRDTLAYIAADISGLEKKLNDLTSKESTSSFNLAKFNAGMADVEVLTKMHEQTGSQLSYDLQRYTQIQAAHNSTISAIILIEEGQTPISKSRPKRSIIVLAATMIAFITSLLAILLIESYKDINWKEIIDAG